MTETQLLWVGGAKHTAPMRSKIRAHCARVGHRQHEHKYWSIRPDAVRRKKRPNYAGTPSASENDETTSVFVRPETSASSDTLSDLSALNPQSDEEHLAGCEKIVKFHGNSDPFQCQAINVTPLVTYLFNFFLYTWAPAKCLPAKTNAERKLRNHIETAITQSDLAMIHNEAGASAVVLLSATVLTKLTPSASIERKRTSLKLKMISRLQSCLGKSTPNNREISKNPIWLSHALFIVAVSEMNMTEATTHGEALSFMLQEDTKQHGFKAANLKLLFQVLAYEVNRAAMTLTPSILDTRHWLPAVLDAHFPDTETRLKPFKKRALAVLDPVMRDTPMESVVGEVFAFCYLYAEKKLIPTDDGDATSSPASDWESLRYYYRQLQFLEYYFMARDLAQAQSTLREACYWNTQACIPLSILLRISDYSNPKIAGRTYWPLGAIVSDRLKQHLSDAMAGAASDGSDASTAWLLAAWVGATKRYDSHPGTEEQKQDELSQSFFFTTFREVASKLKMTKWDEVCAVIRGFSPIPIPGAQRGTQIQRMLMPDG